MHTEHPDEVAARDVEIRAFLQRNPDVLRRFLDSERRLGVQWLRDWLTDEVRRGRMVLR